MKFSVTSEKIEFKYPLRKIIIPAGANIKIYIYNIHLDEKFFGFTFKPFPSYAQFGYSAKLVADKKIQKGIPPFFYDYGIVFLLYSDLKKFIDEVKKNNFPLGLDIEVINNILSKPIIRSTVVSSAGTKYIPDGDQEITSWVIKNGVKFIVWVFVLIMLTLLLLQFLS